MRGNSGASLCFQGDFVLKECGNAKDQYDWFSAADLVGMIDGFRLPHTRLVDEHSYEIEYVHGYSATQITSVQDFARLVKLIEHWEKQPTETLGSWFNYLRRLEQHVAEGNSEEMRNAFHLASQYELPSSFGHGDLTLENVLVEKDGGMVLIDPNYSQGLFQSYILDYGKLLQSVHSDYHRVFNSSPGEDPAPLLAWFRKYLEERGLWEAALVAELTHIMRLRKYRPEGERSMVDALLRKVMKEIEGARAVNPTSGRLFRPGKPAILSAWEGHSLHSRPPYTP